MNLTQEQQNIIDAMREPDNKNLVLASPGSGKTTVLEHGVGGIEHDFIALTFSNKAAKELGRRLATRRALFIGTFHGLAINVLRNNGFGARLIDDREARAIIRDISRRFEPNIPAEAIAGLHSRIDYAYSFVHPEDRLDLQNNESLLPRVSLSYVEFKADNNLVDFNDLLIESMIYLRRLNPQIVLVDEWQDTNEVQYEMLRRLTNQFTIGMTVVGDIDQTLYEFRGAQYENTRRLQTEAEPRILPLTQTWRFGTTIADACNNLIRHNEDRIDISITTHEDMESKEIYMRAFDKGNEEAWFVANLAKKSKGTFAILCRVGMQLDFIETKLIRLGVEYAKLGGRRLTERAKMRRLIDLMTWVVYDLDESLLQYLRYFKSRLGKRFIADYKEGRPTSRPDIKDTLDRLRAEDHMAIIRACQMLDSTDEDEDMYKVSDIIDRFIGDGDSMVQILDKLKLASYHDEDTRDITLATVHAVKGLEFDTVCIAGMEEGHFPHSLCKEEEVESERRIAYVAASRAKKELWLTWAYSRQIRGKPMARTRSRFIADMGIPGRQTGDMHSGLPIW